MIYNSLSALSYIRGVTRTYPSADKLIFLTTTLVLVLDFFYYVLEYPHPLRVRDDFFSLNVVHKPDLLSTRHLRPGTQSDGLVKELHTSLNIGYSIPY